MLCVVIIIQYSLKKKTKNVIQIVNFQQNIHSFEGIIVIKKNDSVIYIKSYEAQFLTRHKCFSTESNLCMLRVSEPQETKRFGEPPDVRSCYGNLSFPTIAKVVTRCTNQNKDERGAWFGRQHLSGLYGR